MMAISSAPDTPEPTAAELIAARPHLAMHAMDGLMIDDVPLNAIADDVGTPVWVYSAAAMRRRYRMLAEALTAAGLDAHIHYAMKANDRLAVLRLFAAEGAGADVVSEGELRRAREAGIAADRIVFSGVGKSERELRLALAEDIAQINVESAEELDMLSALATGMGRTAPRGAARQSGCRCRHPRQDHHGPRAGQVRHTLYRCCRAVSPGGRAAGHSRRSGWRRISAARSCRWRRIVPPMARLAELVRALRADGLQVDAIDCGGGLGIPYRDEPAPLPAALAGAIRGALHGLDVRVAAGTGALAGRSGGRAAGVGDPGEARAGQPLHRAGRGDERSDPTRRCTTPGTASCRSAPVDAVAPVVPADVVGPVCESGDTFARNRMLPPLAPARAWRFSMPEPMAR